MNRVPLVAICVATYMRPRYFGDLLVTLASTEVSGFTAHLIVTDNDACGGSRPIVERVRSRFSMPITYLTEPQRGIASARNRLVREAEAVGADFVAFVDDDQLVEPGWLRALVDTANETSAEIVAGRALPRFEQGVPSWAHKTYSCVLWFRPGKATGAPAKHFGTDNVLIRTKPMMELPGPFNERFNLTGGSDSEFFDQMRRHDHTAVWCQESIVYERIPPSRATLKWMVLRGFRLGVGFGLITRTNGTGPEIAIRSIRSIALMGKSTLRLLASVPKGRAGIYPQLSEFTRALGIMCGLLNRGERYREYTKIHGE